MRGRLRDVPGLLRTREGRSKIRGGIGHYFRFLTRPAARLYRRTVLRRTRIVAVVGSFGKTTTHRLIAATVRDIDRKPRLRVVKAIFHLPMGQAHAVFELGIDRPGQMAPMAHTIAPDIAVVTCIGSEHLCSMGTIETTRNEKAAAVRELSAKGVAILNGDDENVLWMASQTRARVITFGLAERNDVRASEIAAEWPGGLSFLVHAGGETRRLQTMFHGRHFVPGFLAAAAVALAEGISLDDFANRVENVAPVNGRMHVRWLPNGAALLCDYFKSSYETMHAALDTLAEIPAERRIVVFGDISEPPGSPAQTYGVLGERIAGIAGKAIFLGNGFRRYRAGAVRAGMDPQALMDAGDNVQSAIDKLRMELRPGDVVLIKGRGEQRLDRVALGLEGRSIGCTLVTCGFKAVRCRECSRLEKGWEGRAQVT